MHSRLPSVPSQPTSQLRALIAANLDQAIAAKELTNRQVADAIGSTEHQVWRWRRGHVKPLDETLAALGSVLERDLAWFYVDHQAAAA